ncbi:hypothetical protein KC319_g22447, partial [Hortaea werneckii]
QDVNQAEYKDGKGSNHNKNLAQTGNKKKQPKQSFNAGDEFLDVENPMAQNHQPSGPPQMPNSAAPPVQPPLVMGPPGPIPAPPIGHPGAIPAPPMGPPPIPVEHLHPNQGSPMSWNNAGPPPHMPPIGGGMPNPSNHPQHQQNAFEPGPILSLHSTMKLSRGSTDVLHVLIRGCE